ncbi:NAD-dependent methylenetetrahydrofolate dehydrogenase [Operophtera brumata]|uniref:methenyltetrahydrofolate cyclohydrolase n=1 Tax=Operophtera brumata TaxID=104452 RepID=A0A0L7LFQ8_OPEBR|nr:NAD-dependent methylenetetrahydrofolate dehydrogenase [Operophtera brumata]
MRQIFSLRIVSSLLTSKMRSHTYIDSFGSARMMAQILDGKALSGTIKNELKIKIANWVSLGNRPPSLRCIIVGDDPASHTYVNNKIQAAAFVGINAETIKHDSNISEEQLIAEIQELNADSNIDGILVQLPVPDSMNERRVCNTVSPEKDVDGFHIVNVGQLCLDMPTINVGMPIAMMLHSDKRHDSGLGMDATVTICHRHTPADKLAFYCRNADIIITATVPGGVGPMTVTMLMHNTFQAAQNQRDRSLQ